jgi:protein SCO1
MMKLKRQCLVAGLALLGSLANALPAFATQAPERTLLATPPRTITDFTLTNQKGRALKISELRGAPVLVFFGFANCPTICPAVLQQLQTLETRYAKDLGATRVVVISVDGERDTPEVMESWLAPISPKFTGLTGSPDKVRQIAEQFTAAFYKAQADDRGRYLVDHSTQLFLLDAEGRLGATFFNAPVATVAEVVRTFATKQPATGEAGADQKAAGL